MLVIHCAEKRDKELKKNKKKLSKEHQRWWACRTRSTKNYSARK